MSQKKYGPYLIQDVLGRGGMGTVYRATDVNSDAVVAVKALAPTFSFDERFRQRFEAEIDALIQLDHPNIVRLISYGQEEGNLFYAMELVDGHSLFELQKQFGKFEWQNIIDIALDVSKGLRHAHDRGIIHRDLKPGNLMLDKSGLTKLGDFGIAKTFGGAQMTGEGNVLGTMDFMAPEHAQGKPVTIRSDLYSFGVVLYTLLTGRPPFSADSMEETVRNVTAAKIQPIKNVISDLPRQLAEVIHDLIQKNPDDRIQTAQALIHRLEEVKTELLESSEAQTHIVDADEDTDFKLKESDSPATDVQQQTLDDSQTSVENTRVGDESEADLSAQTRVTSETIKEGVELQVKEEPETQTPDYFNPVTKGQRDRYHEFDSTTDPETGRKWPLVLGLIVVLALIGIGIYFQVFRQPTADALLKKIEDYHGRPAVVRDEIDKFLELYPDHERFSEINTLRMIVDASAFQKRLQRQKRNSSESITSYENEFLYICENSREKPIESFEKLNSFIELHEINSAEDERVADCVAAARNYLEKIRFDSLKKEEEVDELKQSVKSHIEKARSMINSDPGAAKSSLQAIIKLYGEEDWAEDLIEQAQSLLKTIH